MELLIRLIILTVVAGLVYYDAQKLGVRKNLIKGFFNMSAAQWAILCFLFLIIGLPAYLILRPRYKRLYDQRESDKLLESQAADQTVARTAWPPPPDDPR